MEQKNLRKTQLNDTKDGSKLGDKAVTKEEHVTEHQMSQQMKLKQLRQQSTYNEMVQEENRNKEFRIDKGEGVKRQIDLSVVC